MGKVLFVLWNGIENRIFCSETVAMLYRPYFGKIGVSGRPGTCVAMDKRPYREEEAQRALGDVLQDIARAQTAVLLTVLIVLGLQDCTTTRPMTYIAPEEVLPDFQYADIDSLIEIEEIIPATTVFDRRYSNVGKIRYSNVGKIRYVTGGRVNLRDAPDGQKMGGIFKGRTKLEIVEEDSTGWTEFTVVGWIWKASTSIDTTGKFRSVTVNEENFRATPNGKKIGRLLRGTALTVLEDRGKWIQVSTKGWIWNKLTGWSPPKSKTPSKTTIRRSAISATADRRISGKHYFGCRDRKYFNKLVNYAVQEDTKAFSQALAAGIFAGICTMLKDGEVVYIMDTAIFSGLIKVRRKGQTQEYWTNREAVK